MEINDNKAGMEGLDKVKINAIIRESSKNSNFVKFKEKRDERVKRRVEQHRRMIQQFTTEQLKSAEREMDRLAEELESKRDLRSTVVHIDMDCFFAAVEMMDNPSLRDKPMAVGSNSMLSTSNYAARRYGVRAAQPGFIGRKLCPELIIVPPRFDRYCQISERVRSALADEYDPNLSMSVDEAYLHITQYLRERRQRFGNGPVSRVRIRYAGDCLCKLPYDSSLNDEKNLADYQISTETCEKCGKIRKVFADRAEFGNSAEEVVREMRFTIEQVTGLTASAGIAVNSLLAKICSDRNKPNGQFYLKPDRATIMNFIRSLPIRKVCGIGAVTESMLKGVGVETCADLYEKRAILYLLYSKISSRFFLKVSLGVGSNSFIEHTESDRKSMSVERTFTGTSDPAYLHKICRKLCIKLANDLEEEELKGRTVTLKLKTVDFEIRTRARSLKICISDAENLHRIAKEILDDEISTPEKAPLKLRLMGVRLSSLVSVHESDSLKKLDHCKEITDYFKPCSSSNFTPADVHFTPATSHFTPAISHFTPETCDDSSQADVLIDENSIDSVDQLPIDPDLHEKPLTPEEKSFVAECDQKLRQKIDNRSIDDDVINRKIDDDVIRVNHTSDKCDESSVLLTSVNSSDQSQTNLHIIDPTYLCPVCQFKLLPKSVKNLHTLNLHIDACLSRRTIGELLSSKSIDNLKKDDSLSIDDSSSAIVESSSVNKNNLHIKRGKMDSPAMSRDPKRPKTTLLHYF